MGRRDDIRAILERYDYILFLLQQHDDKDGLLWLTKLVEDARKYVRYIATIEIRALHEEGSSIADETERLDAVRKIFHDAVIDDIYILNRHLFKVYDKQIPTGGIFTFDYNVLRTPRERLSVEQRCDFADWIELFVEALAKR